MVDIGKSLQRPPACKHILPDLFFSNIIKNMLLCVGIPIYTIILIVYLIFIAFTSLCIGPSIFCNCFDYT